MLPFLSTIGGNPYIDPKINLYDKIDFDASIEGKNTKLYAYSFGASCCQYKHLLNNTLRALKRNCKKSYNKHSGKGILILTEKMYLQLYVEIAASKEKVFISKKEDNSKLIKTSTEAFAYKFIKDIKKEFSYDEIEKSQFKHIYIVLNMYGKPLIIPMLYFLLNDVNDGLIGGETSKIEKMTRFDIKGKNDPIYNAKKI